MKNRPPKLFLKFFQWFCHPGLQKPIEGDLMELYEERIKDGGKKKADLKFIRDVLLLFRPSIIKPADGTYRINNYGMLKHNVKLAFRSFKRFKTSFTINLIGLSTGLASVFLIYLWITDELSVDKFHMHEKYIYQVMHNIHMPDGIMTIEPTPALLGQSLEDEISEVEMAASVLPVGSYGSDRIIQYEGKKLKVLDQYASERFFQVFSFELLRGDRATVLAAEENVAISDEIAERLFGSEIDPVGKIIEVTSEDINQSFKITGVFKKPPLNSTQNFDIVFTLETFLKHHSHIREWGNSDPGTYLVLNEKADPTELSERLRDYVSTKLTGYRHKLFLQKYSDRYLNGSYENGVVVGGRIQYVQIFSIVATLVLLIACINFMNLSTARASRRLKEIGVKKAMGAKRASLMAQHLTEAFLMTFIAIGLAVMISVLVLPYFNTLTGKAIQVDITWDLLRSVAVIGALTAVLAGSYPALYLSGFDPIKIFKGKITGSIGELWARRGLVIFQFCISILLVSSILIISSQVDFIQNKNLGFKKDHVIYFNSDGELKKTSEVFLEALKNESAVINAGMFGHDLLGGMGTTSGIDWEGKGPDEFIQFGNLEVGFDLIETFGFELAAGRTFSSERSNENTKILFNEKAIEAMGLEDPIGKIVSLWGREREIIGVVKNFHFESLHKEIRPCFLQLGSGGSSIVVRIAGGDELRTIERINEIYREHNPGLSFDFKFFDQEYDALYQSEQQIADLSKAFGVIAILVSCLGLFGLVAFTSEKRQKEIGIRKVLGSSEYNLILLLTSDFSKMIGAAIIISLPLSYILMRHWLDSFAYRIPLDIWFFVIAGTFSMLVAWTTMSFQTLKTAKANPVKALKYE